MTTSIPAVARYDATLRILHWAMAAIILAAIALGVIAAQLPPGVSPRVELLTIHKSLGMTALVLVVLRVAWRLSVGAPPYSASLGVVSRVGAHAAHVALYALMIAMPVSGYVDSVIGGHPTSWFGLFDWPALVARNDALADAAGFVHHWLAWAIGAALALHFAAVVWHAWVKRDEIFSRMWLARAGGANG
jgi:cytochrome b561